MVTHAPRDIRLVLAMMGGFLVGTPTSIASVFLEFDTALPGTIADVNGLGTGFTHRLLGTGAAIPIPDPNSDILLNPGYLTLQATPGLIGGFGGGVDLPHANLPGLLLTGVFDSDFLVTAKFDDVDVAAHQLAIYVGTRSDLSIRAGFHGNQQFYLAANLDGAPDFGWSSGSSAFPAGDDIIVTLQRSSGNWSLQWENLTHPELSGSSLTSGMGSGETAFPELDAEADLFVGLMHSNQSVSSSVPAATVDYFRVDAVPEPASSVTFLGVTITALLCGAGLRRRGLSRV